MINQIIHGDCLEVLKSIPDNYFDSLITDPPAGISFMSKNWDDHKGGMLNWINWFSEVMNECLRTMKPGACGLVWSIPRTSHWTGMALELAGFRLIDVIHHCQGEGFPKGQDISKHIDAIYKAEREIIGKAKGTGRQNPNWNGTSAGRKKNYLSPEYNVTASATSEAKQWDGWKTPALKPSVEGWWLVQKPISESSIARNILKHGVGGINVEACRIESGKKENFTSKIAYNVEGYRPNENLCYQHQNNTTVNFVESCVKQEEEEKLLYSVIENVDMNQGGGGTTIPLSLLTKEGISERNTGMTQNKNTYMSLCTSESGKHQEDQFQKGTLCTISTKSNLTTDSKILQLCQQEIISACTTEILTSTQTEETNISTLKNGKRTIENHKDNMKGSTEKREEISRPQGRYPSNLILSCGADCDGDNHSPDCPVSVIGEQSGICTTGKGYKGSKDEKYFIGKQSNDTFWEGNTGTAARYFKQLPFDPETVHSVYYQAKASTKDRNCNGAVENIHPTVKSRYLMQYLIKLITPPDGIVLDPFGGSGTTAVAAKESGFNYVLIEKEQEYVDIINQRLGANVIIPELVIDKQARSLQTRNNKVISIEKHKQLSLFS